MERESIYWFIVFLSFIYIISRNSKSAIKILIILSFYSGLASFSGKAIENPYKIVLVLFSIYLLFKNKSLTGLSKREFYLLIVFILFSISFLYSAVINGDYFTLTFSQYGKYVTPICIFFILNRLLIRGSGYFLKLRDLIFSLLTIQILLSFVKILTIGLQETTVGSLAYIGGGPATMLPVLGFILLWVGTNGELKRKDWRYTVLLFFIGLASLKRAILFIMPAFILLFMYYVPGKVRTSKLLFILSLLPLIFYLGVRLNPTLNKENKIGGTFDLQFVLGFTQEYSFGKTSEKSGIQLGTGRGGATLLLWSKLFSNQSLSSNDIWGFGLQEVYTTNYEEFNNEKFDVNSKGAVTGVFQSYISAGYIGILLTILLIISILYLIKVPRIRIALAILFFWDYLFYSGLILRTQGLFILFFFIIIYSNLKQDQLLVEKDKNLNQKFNSGIHSFDLKENDNSIK
jgi:hypothetical protein